jgi:hypothetical protein
MSQQVTRLVAETPRLTWLNGSAVNGDTPLNRNIVVGREPNNCDVLLESDLASRLHAEIVLADGGHVELVDLNSSNGTFVNGRRVASVRLADGDRIGFGSAEEAHCVFRAAPPATVSVEEPGPGPAEAATAILSSESRRCPKCSRLVTSALGECRYCSAGRARPSGDAAGAQGRPACASCGTPAREGGSFCHRCGARLSG